MEKKLYKKWNYSFEWTKNHLSPEEMNPLRYQFDELGSAALEKLQQIAAQNDGAKDRQGPRQKLDLYALLRDNYATDPVLQKFWSELNTVPDWVDWDQIARGQKFFCALLLESISPLLTPSSNYRDIFRPCLFCRQTPKGLVTARPYR